MKHTPIAISFQDLYDCVASVFGVYLPEEDATRVAEYIVEADLRGVSSHGISRMPAYTRRLRAGQVNARPNLRVTRGAKAAAHVDGDNGMGFVVGAKAMQVAIEIAKDYGVGIVTASHSNHYGMSSCYIRQAFANDLAAIALTNAAPLMPVWGGKSPFLGTNPFAMGLPGKTPILLDMATSVVAYGKIRRSSRLGEAIPEGWGLDARGRNTTDPAAVLDGGVVLPLGGPKGSGLALMIDAVAGMLSGAAFAGKVCNQNTQPQEKTDAGHFFLAFDPAAFMPRAVYEERLAELVAAAKASDRAEGFTEILMPGEREDRLAATRKEHGLELPEADIAMLREEARLAGVAVRLPD